MRKRLTKTIWYGSGVDSSGNPILPSANGGLDGLNYGELFLHLSNSKVTLWTLSSEGKIVEITGGGSDVDMSSYLLKSIWDKAFEFRTDKQGVEYIFSKLPVVAQYGITMYAGSDVNVPSLASGLPFDNKTIWYNPDTNQIEVIGGTGGGGEGGVSNFWDLSGIPSWITMSKPKYTYSEIEGTPDLSKYALGTELGKYVTLDTDQSLKGKKDFKNGLSIDGLELRKSQDDVIYIDANLVVRGGVTMYAQNEVDIPSIIDSIPTASTTVKGIASFDGNYFSVDANGKVSLISGSGGIDENELADYLNRNNYAKKSDIPSLVGYATQSWVNTRIDSLINGAPAAYDTLKEIADVLQGNVNSIGDIITALGTKWTQDNTKIANWDTAYSWGNHASAGYALKSYVDSTFVTLGSKQTITGEKNFTGGIKVNGSPIYYDSTKKYWKLEGDLLVTGGVTMYGSDSEFTPSTIMDAIQTDGVTIRVNPTTKNLEVIGNTSGATTLGGLSNVGNWADSVADVDRIMYQAAGSSNWVSKNLSDLELKGDYLPLSGGTLTGSIRLTNNMYLFGSVAHDTLPDKKGYLTVYPINSATVLGAFGDGTTSNITTYIRSTGDNLYHRRGNSKAYKDYRIWDESNLTPTDILTKLKTVDGSGSGLDADLLDGLGSSVFARNEYINNFITSGNEFNFVPSGFSSILWFNYRTKGGLNGNIKNYYFANGAGNTENVTLHAATFSGNSSSATKLETPRTIWGQSFDGSGNVSGDLSVGKGDIYLMNSKQIRAYPTSGSSISLLYMSTSNNVLIGNTSYNTYLGGANLQFRYGNSAIGMILNSSGNVLIGTTTDSGYKLDVNGTIHTNSSLWIDTIEVKKSQDDVLYIDANVVVRGGITMYGTNTTSVPSILDSLPIASTTTKGIASFDSNFFSVGSDGKVTFIGSNNGGVADSVAWSGITGKPTTLSGYGITDAKISNGVITLGGNTITPLTSHQTIYNLTLQAGSFSAVTFDPNGAAKTVNIPTTTSHISEGTNLYYTDARAQAAITGGASTIKTSNLTKSRALISNSSGKVAVSTVTSTELGYLDGVTSSIQTQLNGKLSLSGGTINGSGSYSAIPLVIKNNNSQFSGLSIYANTTERVHLGYWSSLGGIRLENMTNGYGLSVLDNGNPSFYYNGSDGTFVVRTLLHSDNYSTYTLPKSRVIYHTNLDAPDPNTWDGNWMGMTNINTPDGTNYFHILSSCWGNDTINNHKFWSTQLALPTSNSSHIYYRTGNSETTFYHWIPVLDSLNYYHYALPLTGGKINGEGDYSYVQLRLNGNNSMSNVMFEVSNAEKGLVGYSNLHGLRLQNALSTSGIAIKDTGEAIYYTNDCTNTHLTITPSGYVGIGTTSPSRNLHIVGSMVTEGGSIEAFQSVDGLGKYAFIKINEYYTHGNEEWASYIVSDYYGTNWCATGGFTHGMYFKSGRYGFDNFIFLDSKGNPVARLSTTSGAGNHHFMGNVLASGGFTMYSDQRKKTILNRVELSLKDIANAPLIEHYYNSDINKTTHVGSIAQYWASMNDWFCKLDNEGFYTMEIQNCALASAISIARELDRYESKTDKTIKQLKKRICQLEEEVERLRAS